MKSSHVACEKQHANKCYVFSVMSQGRLRRINP